MAGCLGALTGLGGGVVVTPALTLLLGVDIRYAIGASLVSVIATSSGAAAAFVREGYSNIRIGMFLEIATTLGALVGAFLATRTPTTILSHNLWLRVAACGLAIQSRTPERPEAEDTRSPGEAFETGWRLSIGGGPSRVSSCSR